MSPLHLCTIYLLQLLLDCDNKLYAYTQAIARTMNAVYYATEIIFSRYSSSIIIKPLKLFNHNLNRVVSFLVEAKCASVIIIMR